MSMFEFWKNVCLRLAETLGGWICEKYDEMMMIADHSMLLYVKRRNDVKCPRAEPLEDGWKGCLECNLEIWLIKESCVLILCSFVTMLMEKKGEKNK